MKDYSLYIAVTYGLTALALLLLAAQSYRAMKRAKRDAAALRRARKGN
jgi:heme exporter protein CcmD